MMKTICIQRTGLMLGVQLLLVWALGCQSVLPVEMQAPVSGFAPTQDARSFAPMPARVDFIPSPDLTTAVQQVAQRVKPAVVQITNEQVQVDQFSGPFAVPAGMGSGVIYDTQGHILTNNHVVEGAQELMVSLPDGRSFKAKLVGRDPQTDLAVVQISGSSLPYVELGDSGLLEVGQWVVAIGNALALPGGPTVTAGVVSALERTAQEPGSSPHTQGTYLFDLIQTDASINPGNSGGALANLAGQVVGINTMVAGQAEPGVQAQGIGFAISVAVAKPIADQLVAKGHIVHADVGMSFIGLTPTIAVQIGIPPTDGVLVSRVVAGGPASSAGLKRMDVIIQADGTPLLTDTDLAQVITQHKPGDHVTFEVLRGKETLKLAVLLAEAPSPQD